jgi:putative multiple sugar transport system permease protein
MTDTNALENKRQNIVSFIKSHIRDYILLFALISIMVFFQIATQGILFKPVNLTNIILQNSYIIVMALGMLLVIVAGHIDLSVGSVSGFIGGMAALLITGTMPFFKDGTLPFKFDSFSTGLICIALGAAFGAVQGYFVAYHKIPAFIVTLAGMLMFRGLRLQVLGGASVGPFPTTFQSLSNGYLPDIFEFGGGFNILCIIIGLLLTLIMIFFNVKERRSQMTHGLAEEPSSIFVGRNILIAVAFIGFALLMASYKGLPNVLIVMSALIALFIFVTTHTTFGRRIYAMGGNEKATKLSGVNTERLTFLVFTIMGALAALAGLIYAARLNVAGPKAGDTLELDVIAACFIGGAAVTGGVGKVTGTVIGAFIIGVMNNGMSLLGVDIGWQFVIKGAVLLLAVFLDVKFKNRG